MSGYSPKDVVEPSTATISGVVTNRVVSKEFPITAGGSTHFVVKLDVSGVTVVGAITAKLQTAIDGEFEDSKTAAITVNGNVYIRLNVEVAGDQAFLPLLAAGRVVVTTTNAGDAVVVDHVSVLQEL